MSKRVLISGGGGFVGSHLAHGYSSAGHRVTAIDSDFDAATIARLRQSECIAAPLTSESLAALSGPFDLVIHAAAVTSSPAAMGQTGTAHLRRNLDLLLDTLDYAQRTRVPVFVFVSSSGVFAAEDAADVLLETTPPTAQHPYALAKRLGEEIVAAAAAGSLRALSVRLGYIYGPHERARPSRVDVSLIRRWLDCTARGEPIVVETPGLRRDWTYAGDLAAALEAALAARTAIPLVHLGSGSIVADIELAQLLLDVAGRGELRVAPAARPSPAKPPMGTLHPLRMAWTSLAAGLAATLAEPVAA